MIGSMSGSPLGASVELLHALLGVFFLLVPVVMTFWIAQRRQRSHGWVVLAAIFGCVGFVRAARLAQRWELDAALSTVFPLVVGLTASSAITLVVRGLPPGAGTRAWPVLREENGEWQAATLSVARRGLALDGAVCWRVPRAQVLSVEAQEAAVAISWRGPDGGTRSLSLLPMQEDLGQSEGARAAAIADRIRRVLRIRSSSSGPRR
jgi:hypothetical protein